MELECLATETALEWDSEKVAGEFVPGWITRESLDAVGIIEISYLPSQRQRYLFIRIQNYSHIGRLLRILILTQLGYRSLILGMIWERIVDYPHFWLSLRET